MWLVWKTFGEQALSVAGANASYECVERRGWRGKRFLLTEGGGVLAC